MKFEEAHEKAQQFVETIGQCVLGKQETVSAAVACLLSRGHLLLEDVPGVGKTTLARAFSRILGCSFQRIQFTSDLLPSDLLGVSVFVPQKGEFQFRPGPLFHQIILADELNRTPPKTQSAMLEAMAEGQVSVENAIHTLPKPFFVIATENPHDFHGTYPLPEGQLDRFALRLRMGYPDPDTERLILRDHLGQEQLDRLPVLSSPEEILALQDAVDQVKVSDALLDYLLALVDYTRKSPQFLKKISTRAAKSLLKVAQSWAMVHGRAYVLPDDLQQLIPLAWVHRVQGAKDPESLIEELLSTVPVPI